jgi:hypothetical protein
MILRIFICPPNDILAPEMPKSRAKRRRRQPPPKAKPKRSAEWVGILFFLLLGTGVVVLIGNYVGVFGPTSNWRLWYGLGLVAGSFVVATQWH